MTLPKKARKTRWSVLILMIVGATAIIATISEQTSKTCLQVGALAASDR